MANGRKEVSLVIRAQDQATKVFESAVATLETLLGVNKELGVSATTTGARLDQMSSALTLLTRTVSQISGAVDNATAAFARQQAVVTEQRSQLQALQGQAAATARAIETIQAAIVSQRLDGGDTGALVAQLRVAEESAERFQVEIGNLSSKLLKNEAALERDAAALVRTEGAAVAASIAQREFGRAIDEETAALKQQSIAATTNAELLSKLASTDDPGQIRELNQQVVAHNALIEKLKAEQVAQTELLRIEQARGRENAFLTAGLSGKSARDSASVFDSAFRDNLEDSAGLLRANAAAEKDMADAAARLRGQIDPLSVIQADLNRKLAEANALYRAGRISQTELAAATKLLTANSERLKGALAGSGSPGSKPTLFGLKPYDIQNLSFQINDVFTQIASGTSVTQTLAQQGGQILQIFPKAGSAIVAAFRNPYILAFAAAVTAVTVGLRELQGEAARLREFEGAIGASGESLGAQAESVERARREIDRYGVSTSDSIKIVRTLMREGLNPALFDEFGKSAKDMADILGIDLPAAAKQVADGFTGGYESIVRLNQATDALNAEQLTTIRRLFEEGRAAEARSLAYKEFDRSMSQRAQQMRGPWSEATMSLANAWQSFSKYLSETAPVVIAGKALDALAGSVKGVADAINEFFSLRSGAEAAGAQVAGLRKEVAGLEADLAKLEKVPNQNLANVQRTSLNLALQRARARLQEAEDKLAATQATNGSGANGDPKADTETAKAERNRILERMSLEDQLQDLRERGARGLSETESKRRIDLAGELALKQAIAAEEDSAIAAAKQKAAIEKETSDTIRQNEAALKDSTIQTSKLLQQFEGFQSKAKWDVNAFRAGFGSDTVTRADGRVERVMADTVVTLDDAIRDLDRRIGEFQNVVKNQIGSERFGQFSAQQQAALTSIAYNYGSLPDRIIQAVKTGTSAEIADAVRGLAGDNGGVNAGRRNREASILGAQNQAVAQGATEAADKQVASQKDFNDAVAAENQTRLETIRLQGVQNGLTGEALINAQKEQFVSETINAQRAKAAKDGVQYTRDQENWTRALAEAEFEATRGTKARADAARDAAEKPVQNLEALRSALQSQFQSAQQQGDQNTMGRVKEELVRVNEEYRKAIDNAIAYWQTQNGPEAAAAIARLNALKSSIADVGNQFLMTGQQLNESFAQGAANAFDRFAQAVVAGENVIKSLRDAFLQFASDFLRQIAQMIIKQAVFNAIGGNSPGGGLGGGISSIISGLFHDGGVVGQGGQTRAADSAWFRNAMRYHEGGIAGLKPGEVPAILQRGEEVLTANDPRHVANGGGAAGGGLKVVNVFSPADVLANALSDSVGERVLLNYVRNNGAAFKAAMG